MKDLEKSMDKYLVQIDGATYVKDDIFSDDGPFCEDILDTKGVARTGLYPVIEFLEMANMSILSRDIDLYCNTFGLPQLNKYNVRHVGPIWFLKIPLIDTAITLAILFANSPDKYPFAFVDGGELWGSSYFINSLYKLRRATDDHIKNRRSSLRGGKRKTYLMIDEHTGLIKIGYSVSPSTREKTLCSQTPKIKLLFVLDKDIERSLHSEFSHKRERGEWFNLSMDEVLDIANKHGFKAVGSVSKKKKKSAS